MSRSIYDVKLAEVLPFNMVNDPKIAAICAALDVQNKFVVNAINSVIVLADIGNQPANVTDLLAIEQQTPYYDQNLPLNVRQRLIANTGKINSIKGTKAAIEEVAVLVFGRSWVDEWFDYGGQPYCFRVNVEASQQGASESNLSNLQRIIDNLKNARSFLEVINIILTSNCTAYFGVAMTTGEEITVYPWTTREIESNVSLVFGVGYQAIETVTINPM